MMEILSDLESIVNDISSPKKLIKSESHPPLKPPGEEKLKGNCSYINKTPTLQV
jgi:hypothetical protein